MFLSEMDDPKLFARQAGLRYVTDAMPGITRRKAGRGFTYADADGKRITDEATLQRIHELVLPPAYTDVWICPLANGHLQATGRDQAGRKQYRYHEQWRVSCSTNKFEHVLEFAQVLGALRKRVDADLKRKTLDRRRVLAAVIRLLDLTLIRVGNQEYVRQNGSFGLTTLRDKHAKFKSGSVSFRFLGKSGQLHEIDAEDPAVARVVKRCHELPGQHLFQYLDVDGAQLPLDSSDVNEYLREQTGRDVTAKEFRTWGGTVLAAITLARFQLDETAKPSERRIAEAVKLVAARLGNRPATCRKYYIHPAVFDAYRSGRLADAMNPQLRLDRPVPRQGLSAEEEAVLELLIKAQKGRRPRRLTESSAELLT
jgi:DNA topoisomerase I